MLVRIVANANEPVRLTTYRLTKAYHNGMGIAHTASAAITFVLITPSNTDFLRKEKVKWKLIYNFADRLHKHHVCRCKDMLDISFLH